MKAARPPASGFTVVELLIVVAVVAVILTLAAPSFSSFILMQRLKGINAQLVTDLQFARSEAVSRGVPVYLQFGEQASSPAAPSCYILYTATVIPAPACSCAAAEGARCTNPNTAELRTVQLTPSAGVRLTTSGIGNVATQTNNFSFDPRTGGMVYGAVDLDDPPPPEFFIDVLADSSRRLRNVVGIAGRVKVCVPSGSTVSGAAC